MYIRTYTHDTCFGYKLSVVRNFNFWRDKWKCQFSEINLQNEPIDVNVMCWILPQGCTSYFFRFYVTS